MKQERVQKFVVLKGEGVNEHVLYGDFKVVEGKFSDFVVNEEGLLKHETPAGAFAEHHTLKMDKGHWVQGRQVEYNPFERTISDIWD